MFVWCVSICFLLLLKLLFLLPGEDRPQGPLKLLKLAGAHLGVMQLASSWLLLVAGVCPLAFWNGMKPPKMEKLQGNLSGLKKESKLENMFCDFNDSIKFYHACDLEWGTETIFCQRSHLPVVGTYFWQAQLISTAQGDHPVLFTSSIHWHGWTESPLHVASVRWFGDISFSGWLEYSEVLCLGSVDFSVGLSKSTKDKTTAALQKLRG